MMIKVLTWTIVCTLALAATIGVASEPLAQLSAATPSPGLSDQTENALARTAAARYAASKTEITVRMREYRNGRSPVNACLQANQRFLRAALDANVPNASIDYERRALEIEQLAQTHFENGLGTLQEIDQAKAARLNVILRDHFKQTDTQ